MFLCVCVCLYYVCVSVCVCVFLGVSERLFLALYIITLIFDFKVDSTGLFLFISPFLLSSTFSYQPFSHFLLSPSPLFLPRSYQGDKTPLSASPRGAFTLPISSSLPYLPPIFSLSPSAYPFPCHRRSWPAIMTSPSGLPEPDDKRCTIRRGLTPKKPLITVWRPFSAFYGGKRRSRGHPISSLRLPRAVFHGLVV